MSAETRKQLTFGYSAISVMLALVAIPTGWPIHIFNTLASTFAKTTFVLVGIGLIPGVILGGGYLVKLLYIANMVVTPFLVALVLMTQGPLGFLLAIGGSVWFYFFFTRRWTGKAEFVELCTSELRKPVEFLAWLTFVIGSGSSRRGDESYGSPRAAKKGSGVTNSHNLEIVRAEMVRLKEQYPELPTPPEAYYASQYQGWFAEARKRFEMQSFNRTQGERIEVLKRMSEINELCLKIARQEGEKHTFEQEQRTRSKRMTREEMEVDGSIEDLQYEREKKRQERANPRVPSPPPKPPSFVDEITAQLERAVRTEMGVRQVFSEYRKRSPHMSDWLDEWEARILWDLKERKWF